MSRTKSTNRPISAVKKASAKLDKKNRGRRHGCDALADPWEEFNLSSYDATSMPVLQEHDEVGWGPEE